MNIYLQKFINDESGDFYVADTVNYLWRLSHRSSAGPTGVFKVILCLGSRHEQQQVTTSVTTPWRNLRQAGRRLKTQGVSKILC